MNLLYRNQKYEHEDGTVTMYDLQQVQHGNEPATYLVNESPNNQGPGFDSWQTRDAVTREVAATIQNKDGVEPHQVNLYQQRPDGDFDRVSFRHTGHHGDIHSGEGQDWSESQRDVYLRADVEKNVKAELHAPQETPQQLQQRQNQEYQEMSGPQFDRNAVSAAERQNLQNQVDQTNQQQQQSHRQSY